MFSLGTKQCTNAIVLGEMVVFGCDDHAKREKLLQFSVIGNSVPEYARVIFICAPPFFNYVVCRMRTIKYDFFTSSKAAFNFSKQKLRDMFKAVHVTMDLRQDQLATLFSEQELAMKLLNAGAAHKPTYYDFGSSKVDIAAVFREPFREPFRTPSISCSCCYYKCFVGVCQRSRRWDGIGGGF